MSDKSKIGLIAALRLAAKDRSIHVDPNA